MADDGPTLHLESESVERCFSKGVTSSGRKQRTTLFGVWFIWLKILFASLKRFHTTIHRLVQKRRTATVLSVLVSGILSFKFLHEVTIGQKRPVKSNLEFAGKMVQGLNFPRAHSCNLWRQCLRLETIDARREVVRINGHPKCFSRLLSNNELVLDNKLVKIKHYSLSRFSNMSERNVTGISSLFILKTDLKRLDETQRTVYSEVTTSCSHNILQTVNIIKQHSNGERIVSTLDMKTESNDEVLHFPENKSSSNFYRSRRRWFEYWEQGTNEFGINSFLILSAVVTMFGSIFYCYSTASCCISAVSIIYFVGFTFISMIGSFMAYLAGYFVSSSYTLRKVRRKHILQITGGVVLPGALTMVIGSTALQTVLTIYIGSIFLSLIHGLLSVPDPISFLAKLFDVDEAWYSHALKKRGKTKTKQASNEHNETLLTKGSPTEKYKSVAVIGISCRFAQGMNSKDAFWSMLVNGECVIGSYPQNRLEEKEMKRFYNPSRLAHGKHYTLKGAFLDNVAGFDAQFFGISPAECRALDPQQRLLLQVVYEAIEDAGLRLDDLQKCRTGVYVGLMNLDYGRLLLDHDNVPNIDEFASTGITASTAANRISFSLNLTGPSLTVDTACSSSLTALNLAFTHLQSSECDVAIVCAPNLILARYFHTACCRTGLLAEDGRCKSFDAKGDGYGRGEGVAAVVLKETSMALQDRDDAYAEIVACGLNNDGQHAIPMTGPSDKKQAELARRVLQESGLIKEDVQYVETHGTGTAVGDVVEMRSVSDVYGNSSEQVLRIGSVKPNVNHTESTAGLAGLIKVCLMIKHGYFVPTINVHELKPQLMIPDRKMAVQMKYEPWKSGNKPRTAAVCCYGYGGSNAHAIVRQIKSLPALEARAQNRAARIITISARSRDALKAMADRFSEWIKTKSDNNRLLKEDICHTMNDRRSLHSHRLAVTFRSLKQVASSMKMFAKDRPGWQKFAAVGHSSVAVKKVAFIYGGQGTRWHGMAKAMIEHEPKFRESIEEVDAVLHSLGVPWRLTEELMKDESESLVKENPIGQTALFAVHYSLTELLKSWGMTPAAVVGHSLGEISAACAVQAISLKEALQLVLLRSRLHESSRAGRMLAVGMSAEDAGKFLDGLRLGSRVDVAVINSPKNVVLSGDPKAMQTVESHLQRLDDNMFWRRLETTRAFHSKEMDGIKHSFTEGVKKIKRTPGRTKVPFYSTVTGTQIQGHLLTRDHWWQNLRQTVLFSRAVENMVSDGFKVFIEISATPQLFRYVHEIAAHCQNKKATQDYEVRVVATLPKRTVKEKHMAFLHNCPATLFTCGYPVCWDKIQGSGSRSFIRCPTYPWQQKDYWYRDVEPPSHIAPLTATTQVPDQKKKTHPLLGQSVATEAFSGLLAWESEIDLYNLSFLKDHAFQDSDDAVVPGACYVEMGLALVLHLFPDVVPRLRNVTFNNLLTLSKNDVIKFRTRLRMRGSPGKDHSYQITLVEGSGNEILVSEGLASLNSADEKTEKGSKMTPALQERVHRIKSRLTKQPLEAFNHACTSRRFCYGPQFSLISDTWSGETEALCAMYLTDEIHRSLASYVVHPSIIDACFQTLFLLKQPVEKPVPYRVSDVQVFHRSFTEPMYCHVNVCEQNENYACDVTLLDCHGDVVLLMKGFIMADLSSLRPEPVLWDVAFQVQWKQEATDPKTMKKKHWLIIPDSSGFAKTFVSLLPENQSVIMVDLNDARIPTCDMLFSVLEQAVARMEMEDTQWLCVVNFLPVETSSFTPVWENFHPSHELAFESSLVILQAILKREDFPDRIQLVLVTSKAVSLVDSKNEGLDVSENLCLPPFPWSSSLFGFRRTVVEELTAPRVSVIDLPKDPSVNDFQQVMTDLRAAEIAEEIAYRNSLRYVNQIKRLDSVQAVPSRKLSSITPAGNPRPFKLSFVSGKSYLKETTREKVQEDRSEIRVTHASPIVDRYWNKSCDKVVVCGTLTSNTSHPFENDFVMTVCEATKVGNFVVVQDRVLVKLGNQLTAQEAAALGFPMAMSFFVVNELLGNSSGKRILVHAEQDEETCVFASVARSVGASVVCLTTDPRNSSQLEQFCASVEVMEDGYLAGEDSKKLHYDVACFLSKPRSNVLRQILSQITQGGKVVTVSYKENEGFDVFVSRNVSFVTADVENVIGDAKKFSGLFASCVTLLSSTGYLQKLKRLNSYSTSVCDVVSRDCGSLKKVHSSSFDKSGMAFHTITFNPEEMPEKADFSRLPLDSSGFRDDRTYLVVGGIRGFGFEVARWMVENGAKTVMCTARSSPSQEKIKEVERLEQMSGSRILLRQADVTSWKDMSSIMDELHGLPDVAGIVFTAMLLEDQRIKDADLETCVRVVKTKVQGSVILHQMSLSMNLDFFIMFSSIAGVIGNVGQLAYSAANSFLDSLCEYRLHKLGLPALSVDWGTMGGAGILERSKEIANLFKSYGFRLMSCKQGLEYLKDFLFHHADQAQIILCDIDWATYLKSSAYVLHRSPRLRPIKDEISFLKKDGHLVPGLTLEDLSRQASEQRRRTVADFVRNLLCTWTEGGSSEVDLNLALYKYGVDSIGAANMSLQIRNGIGALFEIYYFIQPKTNGLSIIHDILEQVKNWKQKSARIQAGKEGRAIIPDVVSEISSSKRPEGSSVQDSYEKIVPLYVPDDALVKVFMMHSSHKSALANAPFAAGFQHQEKISLYSIGLDDVAFESLEYGSVRNLAQRYVKLIKAEQSLGPYYLAGFSFGGTLCFEVASQLIEQDDEVAIVVMLDTFAWFPTPLTAREAQSLANIQESLVTDAKRIVAKRFLKTLCFNRLGFTHEEFQQLIDDMGTSEQLFSIMENKAEARNTTLDNFRGQVSALQSQTEGASSAHFDWLPPKIHYQETVTYIRCHNSRHTQDDPLIWNAPDSWKSLTNDMNLFSVPGSHFDLLDQPYAALCGAFIMSTASIKHRNHYTITCQPGPRSRHEERLIDWIKQGVDVSIYSEGFSKIHSGKLLLNEEETSLTFSSDLFWSTKNEVINLSDVHNIVPGQYVDALHDELCKNKDKQLIISLVAANSKLYHLLCSNWKQRDKLMDSFEVLLATPILKFDRKSLI